MSEAWVTLATNDSYALGALVLAHSLRRVNTSKSIVVMITSGVTNSMKDQLEQAFDSVEVVNVMNSSDEANLALLDRPELAVTFTKLHCWRLTRYSKCVFLDADTLVLKNCDELFEREEFSAAPDIGWPDCFNSGVFVFVPSEDTYASILSFALTCGTFDGGDQGLLNEYFSDWSTEDIKKHLPFIYNAVTAVAYTYLPAFKRFGDRIKIVHFLGATKPWMYNFNYECGEVNVPSEQFHMQSHLNAWWSIFRSCVLPNMLEDADYVRQTYHYMVNPSAYYQERKEPYQHTQHVEYHHPEPVYHHPEPVHHHPEPVHHHHEPVHHHHYEPVHHHHEPAHHHHHEPAHHHHEPQHHHHEPQHHHHEPEHHHHQPEHHHHEPEHHRHEPNHHHHHHHEPEQHHHHEPEHHHHEPEHHHQPEHHRHEPDHHHHHHREPEHRHHHEPEHHHQPEHNHHPEVVNQISNHIPLQEHKQPESFHQQHQQPEIMHDQNHQTESPQLTTQDSSINNVNTDKVTVDAIEQLNLKSGHAAYLVSLKKTEEEEAKRRQRWEQGQMDYMGEDSFANIQAKLEEVLREGSPKPTKSD